MSNEYRYMYTVWTVPCQLIDGRLVMSYDVIKLVRYSFVMGFIISKYIYIFYYKFVK